METKFLTMRYYLKPTLIGEDLSGALWAVDEISPDSFTPDWGDTFDAARSLTPDEIKTLHVLQAMEQGRNGFRVYGPAGHRKGRYIIGHTFQPHLFIEANTASIQQLTEHDIAVLSDMPGCTTLDRPLTIDRIDGQLIVY